jgi:hypothetical protein
MKLRYMCAFGNRVQPVHFLFPLFTEIGCLLRGSNWESTTAHLRVELNVFRKLWGWLVEICGLCEMRTSLRRGRSLVSICRRFGFFCAFAALQKVTISFFINKFKFNWNLT